VRITLISVALTLIAFVGCRDRAPIAAILVSGELPADAEPTGATAQVDPATSLPTYRMTNSDFIYAADDKMNVVMVFPPRDDYVGESGASLELEYIDAKNMRKREIKIVPDWGHEVTLSLWTALYCCGEGCMGCEPADDSTPDMIYIRSTPLP